MNKRKICISITLVAIFLLLVWELLGMIGGGISWRDPVAGKSVGMIVTRGLGSCVFLTIIVYKGYTILNPTKRLGKAILLSLPAILVVINNLPIYPLISGLAWVDAPAVNILLLFVECFAVALFEESCFRGVVLAGFLEKRRSTKKGQFLSIVFTSAVFGAVHLVNIFMGSSPVAVLMQIGYSFLIGAMCSVVLFKSSNLWLCVMLHAVFNFNGALVPTLGDGVIWEPITVTVTAILAILTTAYMTAIFFRTKANELDGIYGK